MNTYEYIINHYRLERYVCHLPLKLSNFQNVRAWVVGSGQTYVCDTVSNNVYSRFFFEVAKTRKQI